MSWSNSLNRARLSDRNAEREIDFLYKRTHPNWRKESKFELQAHKALFAIGSGIETAKAQWREERKASLTPRALPGELHEIGKVKFRDSGLG